MLIFTIVPLGYWRKLQVVKRQLSGPRQHGGLADGARKAPGGWMVLGLECLTKNLEDYIIGDEMSLVFAKEERDMMRTGRCARKISLKSRTRQRAARAGEQQEESRGLNLESPRDAEVDTSAPTKDSFYVCVRPRRTKQPHVGLLALPIHLQINSDWIACYQHSGRLRSPPLQNDRQG